MRILLLTHSFNSLTQRLFLELTACGHELSIELDIADTVACEAVALFRPDLIVAPFLKRAIPEAVWSRHVCLVVHPGIVGDRGPSALDWAIHDGRAQWGVTVLQAEREMDAGPVWAARTFPMRDATKSSLYRNEVTEAAAAAVLDAVRHFEQHGTAPTAPAGAVEGCWRPLMKQADRRIDWALDDTSTVLRKLRAADGTPGVLDSLFGVPCRLFDAHAEPAVAGDAVPGTVMARRHDAVLRRTRDAAVWIGHVQRADIEGAFKLPAALAFPHEVADLSPWPATGVAAACTALWQDIVHEVRDGIALLHFPFYNGAMSTSQCKRLEAAVRQALQGPQRVLMLLGGPDFWSNGIHLNVIEAATSAADESWLNIQAMNDLTRTLIEATDHLVIAAMQGNAGAGGVFMALAADQVWARRGVVLNPHYRNMGNLYGSEYWTYLLPRRPLKTAPAEIMRHRLPLSAAQAAALGLIDAVIDAPPAGFVDAALERARAWLADRPVQTQLQAKRAARARDELHKPLAQYRAEELARMHGNFYGFDPSYHIARSNFVRRVPHSWTPRHLARHRDLPAGPR